MISKRSVEWTLSDGRRIVAEITIKREVIKSEKVWLDGDESIIAVDKIKKDDLIECFINGQKVSESSWIQMAPKNDKGIVAIIDKVMLKEDTYKLVKAAYDEAVAEAEADKDVAACIDRIKVREEKARKENAEYEAHQKMMNKAMGY